MTKVRARRTTENLYRRFGFSLIAGVDEVGRGCLAGPVLAGAVILHPDRHIPGLADSKLLSADARDALYDEITARALAWAVGSADPREIDRDNIHRLITKMDDVMDYVVIGKAKKGTRNTGVVYVYRTKKAFPKPNPLAGVASFTAGIGPYGSMRGECQPFPSS